MKEKMQGDGVVTKNRRGRFDYDIEDTLEAGLVLQGTEVKSLRQGGGAISDAYALCKGGEVFLIGMKITWYTHGNITNHALDRTRKLLLNRAEISRLEGETQTGRQIIPLSIYFKNGKAKVELGIGKSRKSYDKRQAIKDRDETAQARRATGRHGKRDDGD